MSLRTSLINVVFAGHEDPFQHIIGTETTAAPSAGSYPNAGVGDLIHDKTANSWYITTVAGTTFVKLNA